MKNITWTITIAIAIALLSGCGHSHDHGHDEAEGPEPLSYTLYGNHTELFVEFNQPVVGMESRFAAHFTQLGERFTALEEGTVTLRLIADGKSTSMFAEAPSAPGIFRLAITPAAAGKGTLEFTVKTATYTDIFTIVDVQIYADEAAALAATPTAVTAADEVSYLKEQAWRIDFANMEVKRQPFYQVIRTTGQILTPPADEVTLSSQTSGIVSFTGNNLLPGSNVNAGQTLFFIKSNELVQGQLDADIQQAQDNLSTAKANFERAQELVKDQLISQKEFQEAKLRYESAQTAVKLNKGSKGFYANNQSIVSPISGFLRTLLVSQGQLVPAGQPMAVISKSNKLLLEANLSQRYLDQLSAITTATFKTPNSAQVFNTQELNGRIVSRGKSIAAGTAYVPLIFEISNTHNIIPGTAAEIFLRSHPIPDALVIPLSALIEEQGNFYVYVQTGGESFEKREVKLGGNDGNSVQVLSGLTEGERVVTKGAYQIKLSAASGAMPAHGHEH
jgi:membrane fusion protein, heavy metal efflux system